MRRNSDLNISIIRREAPVCGLDLFIWLAFVVCDRFDSPSTVQRIGMHSSTGIMLANGEAKRRENAKAE